MPEPRGSELLGEWRRVMDSIVGSATSVAGRSQVPRDLLRASQRQLELLQEVVDRERRLQRELAALVIAPVDAVFDLLEETGQTLRLQAEALESAGRALEDTAGLMKRQSERFERTVGALRQPADLAKAAAGVGKRPRREKAAPGAKAPQRKTTAARAKPAQRKKAPSGTKRPPRAK
jgi:hypothetical protein